MTIKASDITSLIELFASSGWDELHVEVEGLHLYLSTNPLAQATRMVLPAATTGTAVPGAGAKQSSSTAVDMTTVPANWVEVKAPNLGTFYRAPKPGESPFVSIGQTISAQTEVCLLEVMKLFTSVTAGAAGIVRRICVNDSEMVEYGQVLMYIEPT